MRQPQDQTNDELALSLDLWAELSKDELTETQFEYFKEIVWRLKLISDPSTLVVRVKIEPEEEN